MILRNKTSPRFMSFLLAILLCLKPCRTAQYDYIVVGAGSAGSIVASQLAENCQSVLLLEAGGDNTDPAVGDMQNYFDVAFNTYSYDFLQWGYKTQPQPALNNRTVPIPRGRVLGGSHSINAAALVLGSPSDWDTISKDINDSDWSWESTEHLREILTNRLDVVSFGDDQVGAAEFIEAAKNVLDLEYNAELGGGIQSGITASRWTGYVDEEGGGVRDTSYDAFINRPRTNHECDTAPHNDLLQVVTYHVVGRLLFSPNDPTAVIGVETWNLRAGLAANFTANKEVVLSAGSYNSPKILLLSGVGPSEKLQETGISAQVSLPGVGENLRDHYSCGTFWTLASLEPDVPFLFQSPTFNMFGPEAKGATSYQFELSGTYGSSIPLRQQSQGTVTLNSTDPLDPPIIDPMILSEDVDAVVLGLQNYILPFFKALVNQGALEVGNISPNATLAELQDFVATNMASNHHPVGTCKVGSQGDPMAVVDSDFKVRGTTGLRVIDASVFPVVPSGNINGPTMVLGLLGAQKILGSKLSDATLPAGGILSSTRTDLNALATAVYVSLTTLVSVML
jgi:choline dehydrogenase